MLNAVVKNLLLNATKVCGPNVDEIMSYIMEQLTPAAYKEIKSFLTWSFSNGKHFGWGNIDEVYAEYKAQGA
jgi:hypothetical protein